MGVSFDVPGGESGRLRLSLLDPIPELHAAETVLETVADLLLIGRIVDARQALDAIDEARLRRYWAEKDRPTRGTRRPVRIAKRERLPERVHREVLARDGWHCRYCGIGVVDRDARRRMVDLLGPPKVWGNADFGRNAALLVLSGVADHVVPATSFTDS
jgi:hypothetical protein